MNSNILTTELVGALTAFGNTALPIKSFILPIRKHRMLMLASSVLLGAFMAVPVEVYAAGPDLPIDGAQETVIGTGGGTHASPLNVGNIDLGETLANSSLTITAGSTVNSDRIIIGGNTTGDGTLTINGAGSGITNLYQFEVGVSGKGTVNIENGATINGSGMTIGEYDTSVGIVTVTGDGSLLQMSNQILIAHSGTGTLNVEDGGRVVTGTVFVSSEDPANGTVTVTGDGSILEATDRFSIGENGKGTLIIAEGGELKLSDGVQFLLGNYDDGTLIIGAEDGETAVGAGTIATDQDIAADDNNQASVTGTVIFNHTETDYDFTHKITGDAEIRVLAGTTIFSGDQDYTNLTRVEAGELIVNGNIDNSRVLVGGASYPDGSRLGGTGTIADADFGANSTLAPGNSIGTMNFVSLAMGSGADFEVEVDSAGNSDLVIVSGSFLVAHGLVNVHVIPVSIGEDGSTYNPSTTYTILQTQGLSGGDFTVSDDFAFLDSALSDDGMDLFLTLTRNSATLNSVAETPNQKSVSEELDDNGPTVITDAIISLSDDDARKAYDDLTGEIHSTTSNVLAENSQQSRNAVLNRINVAFDEETSPESNWWIKAFGSWTDQSKTFNNAEVNSSNAGILIGADGWTSHNNRLGFYGGFSNTDVALDARKSNSDVATYVLGVYGGSNNSSLDFKYGADYSWHSIDTNRKVEVGVFSDALSAGYDASTAQFYGEISKTTEQQNGSFTPFAKLAHVIHTTDAFTENGGVAALTGKSTSMATTFTTLGIRLESEIKDQAKFHASAGWKHAFGDLGVKSQHSFSNGDSFTITGMPIAENSAVVGAGVKIQINPQSSLNISVEGQFADGTRKQSANATFVMKF